MAFKINEIEAKSILTRSGLPGADWVVNPYNGCLFGCMYCYAAQIARWKHPDEEWGTYLDVKMNAPELLEEELLKLEKKTKIKNFGSIFFSSVTDPYVGMEAKYRLTRKCLEVLADFGYEGNVSVQTKSPLVTRDIDVLSRLKDATYAFIGPLLPYFTNSAQKINELLDELQRVGVAEVWFEHINLNGAIKARLYEYLEREAPELIADFEKANTQEYRDRLDQVIYEATKGRNLKLGLGKVIHHRALPKKNLCAL